VAPPNCGHPSLNSSPVEPLGSPQSKIRVANFYLNANGTPRATLDFYDTEYPSKKDRPLISGLAYGQISSYVSPRAADNPKYVQTDYGDLYAFQHGCRVAGPKVDGFQAGSPIQEAGWVNGQQQTVVIADGTDGVAPYASFQTITEVEPKGQGHSKGGVGTNPAKEPRDALYSGGH